MAAVARLLHFERTVPIRHRNQAKRDGRDMRHSLRAPGTGDGKAMVTNSPFSAMQTADRVDRSDEASTGLVGHAMLKVRQSLCGLHGHDSLLHFQHDRMFLRCTSCGHETPGWAIGDTKANVPVHEVGNAPQRPVSAPRHLVGARKIA